MFWPVALPETALPALGKLPSRIGTPRLSLWARVNLCGVSDSVPGAWRPSFSGDISASGEFRLTADGPGGPLLGFPFRDLKLEFERTGSAPVARLSGRGTLAPPPRPPGAPFAALLSGPSFDMVFSHANGQTRLQASANLGGGTVCGFQLSTSERANLLLDGLLGSPGALAFSNLRLIGSALADWQLPALAGFIRPDGAIESPPLTLPASQVRTIGGWEVRDVTVRFNGAGLEVGGSFVIAVRKPPLPLNEFGRISVKGLLTLDGQGVLTGRGQLKLGGFGTEETGFSIDLRKPDRLLPESPPLLRYSGLKLPMNDFSLQPDKFNASIERRFPEGNARVTLHACHWPDDPRKPDPPQSHLKLEFDGRVTLSYDLDKRSLNRKLNGRLDWRAENHIPPAPPGVPWPTSGGFNLDDGSLSLDKDGNFVIASIKDLPRWLSEKFGGVKIPFG